LSRDKLIAFFVWFSLGVVVWATAYLIRWVYRAWRQGLLFPPQRFRAVPYGGPEVLLVLFLVFIAWPAAGYWAMGRAGLIHRPDGEPAASRAGEFERKTADKGDKTPPQSLLWMTALLFPFQVATVLVVLRALSGTRPYQLGLTLDRLGRNVTLGVLGWLVLTPAAYLISLLVALVYGAAGKRGLEDHPLTRMLREGLPACGLVVAVLTAVVAAPVLEELIFRGLLQRWFMSRRWGGPIALAGALLGAVLGRWSKFGEGWRAGGLTGLLPELAAPAFVLVMVPGYFVIRWLTRTVSEAYRQAQPRPVPSFPVGWSAAAEAIRNGEGGYAAGRADGLQMLAPRSVPPGRPAPEQVAGVIYATALLFAAVHSSVWPSPIPLFFLALGLGFLAYRTQSLVAPMVLHGLFNGVAVAYMLLMLFLVPPPEKGSEETSAGSRPPPASTSSFVPGSWWPRRTYASPTTAPASGDRTDDVTMPTSLPSRNSLAP